MTMTTPQKLPGVTVMANGEIRLSADLFPEEARHGALSRGLTVAEAALLAAELIGAAEVVEPTTG
jgi:hypothetical protein